MTIIVACPEHGIQILTELQVDEQIDACRGPMMEWECPLCGDLATISAESPSGVTGQPIRPGFMEIGEYITIQKKDPVKRALIEDAKHDLLYGQYYEIF